MPNLNILNYLYVFDHFKHEIKNKYPDPSHAIPRKEFGN
jgi:hypothetical protein